MTVLNTDPAVTALLVGGPTLHLTYGALSILTDPTFDGPGEYPGGVTLHKLSGPALSAAELGSIDVVLLSHDQHADNLDESGRALLTGVPLVLSTGEAATRLEGIVTALPNWTSVEQPLPNGGTVEITAVPAQHGPDGSRDLVGEVTGFLLQADGLPTIYISGDNASVPVVEKIAARVGPIDIAVLFVGAANVGHFDDTDLTLNALTAVRAARALGDAVIVPVHAEDWAHFSETPERLQREFEYAGSLNAFVCPRRVCASHCRKCVDAAVPTKCPKQYGLALPDSGRMPRRGQPRHSLV
jgi:L-ascorbate metabolism protein UlaG (beta-lactamase superfamily)